MMVKHILSFVCILSASFLFGQQTKGKVIIEKDSRIDALVAREGAIVPPALNPQIEGYRIQLFFDSEKDALNEARSRFFSLYPTIDTYTTFSAPNFFLRVGDFRTRMEAEKIKAEIEDIFPTSFIVQETINLPRLEKEKKDRTDKQPMDFRFGKRYKLCSQILIDDVYSTGTHVKQYPFVAKYKLVDLKENAPFQLVISAPKRSFKLAVQRNRIKRVAKEAIRFNKHILENHLLEHNKQIALFLIFTSREEIDLKTLNRKTEKLFQTIVHQLKTS